MRKAFSFHNEPGFDWNDKAEVSQIFADSECEKHGIQVGWKIVEIQGEALRRMGDNQHTRFHKRIKERLRLKITYHCRYTITFLFPMPEMDEGLIKEQEEMLSKLDSIQDEDRGKNLEALEKLNGLEKTTLLQRPRACQGLLKSGFDELTVLFGEKSATSIQQHHAAWKSLQAGSVLDKVTLQLVDLEYTDAGGNSSLHMATSPTAAEPLLAAAVVSHPSGSSLLRPNDNGERPLEAMLGRVKNDAERVQILKMYAKHAPAALSYALADGRPLRLGLQDDQRQLMEELQPDAIPWTDICDVLHAKDLWSLQSGYVGLLKRVNVTAPDIKAEDGAAVWSFLLCDHCFGILSTKPSGKSSSRLDLGSNPLEHNSFSRQRLSSVWAAIKLMLLLSADENIVPSADHVGESGPVPHTSLKHIAKGLLAATQGPKNHGFDPREPYRKEIVNLVNELQAKTAQRLQSIMDDLQLEDEAAAEAVAREIPCNELHGLVPSGASARQAMERLRLDAKLTEAVENINPVPTPDWVLAQHIDMEMVSTLKGAGCIEKARDLVELVSSKNHLLSPDRLRFSYLHSAWTWAFCADHHGRAVECIREQLGINSSTPPCKGSGDFQVCSFRARSEPKGLPRVLEKTGEALEEELILGDATKILNSQPDLTKEPEELEGEQMALMELLTPGCYVCDILGAEMSVGSFRELMALYRHLRSLTLGSHGFQVVRTKNGFSADVPAGTGGYRDLKLFVLVASNGFTAMAELQVHIHCVLEQKKYMHLSYECYRGSFDHAHLASTWQRQYSFAPPPRSCCAALCEALTGKGSRSAKVAPEDSVTHAWPADGGSPQMGARSLVK